jgi:hypothetical protein
LICVSGRIIGPFHQTVKIWSSHLDIQPDDHQFFVKVRIIGYNPRDFTINQTTQNWRSTACKQSGACAQNCAAVARRTVRAPQNMVSAPRGGML